MSHTLFSNLRNIRRDVRGTSIVSYAVLLGGLAVLLTYGVQQVSSGVKKSLSNQATELKAIADGSSSGAAGASTGNSGSSGSSGSSSTSGTKGKGKKTK